MIEKQLIYLILDKDFYEENKGRVSKTMFTNGTGTLYDTIKKAHENSDKSLTVDEIATLHTEVYNPALTRVARDNFSDLLDEIKEQKPNRKIATTILEALHKQSIAKQIAVMATEMYNNTSDTILLTYKH